MSRLTYYTDVCPDLIVRTDHGNTDSDYKSIATSKCKAEMDGRPCLSNGKCIVAKTLDGAFVKKSTFAKKAKE